MSSLLRRRAAPAASVAFAVAILLSGCSFTIHSGATTGGDVQNPGTAGNPTTTASTTPNHLTTHLSWHSCHGTFRCATLVVPASYSDPSQGTFDIAVIEAPATNNPSSAPDVVMNPGGPGEGGVSFLTSSAGGFSGLRAKFNLVSFDPRGTGASEPVQCVSESELKSYLALPPAPTTPSQVAAVVKGVRGFVHGCVANTPHRVLANVSTEDAAHDMDRLRAALGQSKLDYLGFSYGTYLGSLYAQAFPNRVGAFVLDGAVDPALSPAQSLQEQAVGFEVDLHDFFTYCDATKSCSSSFASGTKAAYYSVMNRLQQGGTLTAHMNPSYGGTQTVTYAVALLGAISSLYSKSSWKYLGQAIQEAVASSEGGIFLALADQYAGIGPNGQVQNILSANIAINCVDSSAPSTIKAVESLARTLAKAAPDFGASEAWGNLACGMWPVKPARKFGPIHLSKPLPILIVGSTHDPATPYAWAKALATQLTGSVLLTRTGDGHTGYFASSCVRKLADRFFETSARPAAGTVCAS